MRFEAIPCGCGGTVQHVQCRGRMKFQSGHGVMWAVNCIDCGMQGPKEKSKNEAVHAWNRGRGCPTPGEKPVPRYEGKIPFAKGRYVSHVQHNYDADTWKDNEPFRATLQFTGVVRGRFELQDAAGQTYQMFKKDALTILQQPHAEWITGWWAFTKHSQQYAIQYLGESNDA